MLAPRVATSSSTQKPQYLESTNTEDIDALQKKISDLEIENR
jgi:hypothetical protein